MRLSRRTCFVVRAAWLALAVVACATSCARSRSDAVPTATPSTRPSSATSSSPSSAPAPTASAGRTQIDPDGDDDSAEPGTGTLPATAHFEPVGRPPLALKRICDLTVLGDALYAAHAFQPLGVDGATITRYRPDDASVDGGRDTKRAFSVAFDWNRFGEPTKGGGGGQGFLRVHAIHGRLYVPDADPPYGGFGISEPGTEGFVFVSDARGAFAPARAPGHRPPLPPVDGGAGAAVLPRAYHVLDAIEFRGRMYASTGSVPPKERAWNGPSPGALHVASADGARWTYEVDYPYPWPRGGVWRLGFLVRFRDRLYAGIQDYEGVDAHDYVYFAPSPESAAIAREDAHPVSVGATTGTLTLRWYADRGRLYWIAWHRGAGVVLRVTDDGDAWREIALPPGVGAPTDVVRFRDSLVVLAEHALVKLDERERATIVAAIPDAKSPFVVDDAFCAAPLAVFRNTLYAGGQRDGTVFALVDGAPKAP